MYRMQSLNRNNAPRLSACYSPYVTGKPILLLLLSRGRAAALIVVKTELKSFVHKLWLNLRK